MPGQLVYPGPVYLFTQAWSTCLPWPGQLVYPGLVNLFTQAWSTTEPCIFLQYGNILENMHFASISSSTGSPGLETITMRTALKS